jgi:hypothetical protein
MKATNPGIFGKTLAQWLSFVHCASSLGVEKAIAEDVGSYVAIESKPHVSTLSV